MIFLLQHYEKEVILPNSSNVSSIQQTFIEYVLWDTNYFVVKTKMQLDFFKSLKVII